MKHLNHDVNAYLLASSYFLTKAALG